MTTFLKPDDLSVIERLASSDPNETIQKRVRLLLLYEAGMKTSEIADKVDLSPGRVLYWRRRYLKDGIDVFGDAVALLGTGEGEVAVTGKSGKSEKSKKSRKSRKSKKAKGAALEEVTRKVRRAEKKGASTDSLREVLKITVGDAEKQRKKLKKSLKGLPKKKAARARSRLKKVDRRIKRAKKVLDKLKS